MSRYSIRSLIFGVTLVAALLGWFTDHLRLKRELDAERGQNWLAGKSWEDRRTHIKDVANEPNPNVPLLLFALSDPDAVSGPITINPPVPSADLACACVAGDSGDLFGTRLFLTAPRSSHQC